MEPGWPIRFLSLGTAAITTLSPNDSLACWQHPDGFELANYQLFVSNFCHLLGVPMPLQRATKRASTADVLNCHARTLSTSIALDLSLSRLAYRGALQYNANRSHLHIEVRRVAILDHRPA